MTETMRIWDAVSKTNPANTKPVNQRGGFTAINAQSQIMEATRQFGPIGEGWGYSTGQPIFHDKLVFVPVTLWHGSGQDPNAFGPMYGGAEWVSDKGRLDSDALKKATTDALTKLLSQLGFNADVFLGKFDDNKYVAAAAREFSGQNNPSPREESESLKQLRRTMKECTSEQECKAWLKKQIDAINMLDEHERTPLEREYVELKAGFAEVSKLAA